MQTIFSTGDMVQPTNEHSTNVLCRRRTTAASVDKETDMIVQLNGFHNHDSDLAKKEIDTIIKHAVQLT